MSFRLPSTDGRIIQSAERHVSSEHREVFTLNVCNLSFVQVESSCSLCDRAPGRFRHKNHLFRVQNCVWVGVVTDGDGL